MNFRQYKNFNQLMPLEGLTQLGISLSVVPCTVRGHDCKGGPQVSLEFEDKLCFLTGECLPYIYVCIYFIFYF